MVAGVRGREQAFSKSLVSNKQPNLRRPAASVCLTHLSGATHRCALHVQPPEGHVVGSFARGRSALQGSEGNSLTTSLAHAAVPKSSALTARRRTVRRALEEHVELADVVIDKLHFPVRHHELHDIHLPAFAGGSPGTHSCQTTGPAYVY